MPMPCITRKLTWSAAAVAALALLAAACGGGEESPAQQTPTASGPASCPSAENAGKLVLTPTTADYFPAVVSSDSDLAVGPNRFVVGLLDSSQAPVSGAQLHFRFFCVTESGDKLFKSEADAKAITIQKSFTHTHTDGTVESHAAGELGVYVTNVDFDSPGLWGVEVSGTLNGEDLETQAPVFVVREESLSPAIGDPAPPSVQPLLKDVADITQIDTSDPPNPAMHQMTIADAVKSGKPSVIVFATPAFCISQVCGPTKSVVDELFAKYQGQANFIHVEPYFIPEARSGKGLCLLPIMNLQIASQPSQGCPQIAAADLPPAGQSWNLETEPWVFIVDAQGKIAGKFEAVVSYDELEQALEPLLARG